MGFGQTTRRTFGQGTPAFAGLPEYKVGGITLDWTTFPAASVSEVTLADGSKVPANVQYVPFGAVLARIDASGKYGPHDAAAGDGRENLVRGQVVILCYTMQADDLHADNPPGAAEGGRVFIDRLKLVDAGAWTNTGAWSVDLQAALPRLIPVDPDL